MKIIHNMRKLMSKEKNGLTLVEVLLAICILALVAAPIMKIIYASLSINLKSRETLAATHCGQSIMEYITSMPFEGNAIVNNGDKGGFYATFCADGSTAKDRLPIGNNKTSASTKFTLNATAGGSHSKAQMIAGLVNTNYNSITFGGFPHSADDYNGNFGAGTYHVGTHNEYNENRAGFYVSNYPYEDYKFDIVVSFDPINEYTADVTPTLKEYYPIAVEVEVYSIDKKTGRRFKTENLLSSFEGSMFNK